MMSYETAAALVFAAGFYTVVLSSLRRTRRMIGRSPVMVLQERRPEELVAVAAMWVFPLVLLASTRWPHLPVFRLLMDIPAFRIAGGLLLIGGLVLQAVSMIILGRSFRIGVDRDRPGPLVRRGPYRYLRHPIYAAFLAYFVGAWLLQPNLVFSVVVPIAVARVVFMAMLEERELLKIFGETYTAYMRTTKRFIPGVV